MPDHYLVKLIAEPHLDNPAEDHPEIHKHFTRYSKGSFEGPVIKISRTKSKISLWSSYEYEDLLFRFALKACPSEEIAVTGAILGGADFTPLMEKIGLGEKWFPTKSKGQTKNYTTEFKSAIKVEKDLLEKLADVATPYVYILFSFTSADKSVTLKIKKKPPRPSSKNPDDSNVSNKLKFATLKMNYDEELLEKILEEIAVDFLDEIPKDWKSITLQNNYEITDLELPKNKKLNSRLIRLNTVRKGTLNRIIEIDKEVSKNEVEFSA